MANQDHHIDRIVRDALEGYEPSFNAEDWLLMEQQLDEVDAGDTIVLSLNRNWARLTAAAVILLVAFTGWWAIDNSNSQLINRVETVASADADAHADTRANVSAKEKVLIPDAVAETNHASALAEHTSAESGELSNKPAVQTKVGNTSATATEQLAASNAVEVTQQNGTSILPIDQNNTILIAKDTRPTAFDNEGAISPMSIASTVTTDVAEFSANANSFDGGADIGVGKYNSAVVVAPYGKAHSIAKSLATVTTAENRFPFGRTNTAIQNINPMMLTALDNAAPKAVKLPLYSTTILPPDVPSTKMIKGQIASIGTSVVADANFVNNDVVLKGGYGVGVNVDWRFADHWSVESGVYYAKKSFDRISNKRSADGDVIELVQYIATAEEHVQVSLVEIPLLVNYHFKSTGKVQPYIGAGMSAYQMQHETLPSKPYMDIAHVQGGTKLAFNDKWSMLLGAQFKASLTKHQYDRDEAKSADHNEKRLYSIGSRLGLMYSL